MKFVFLIFALLYFSGCGHRASSVQAENTNKSFIQPSPTIANASAPYPEEKSEISSETRFEIGKRNQEFRSAPDGFKKTDFKNFKFPVYRDSKIIQEFVRLKSGAYELEDEYAGGTSYELGDVFFVDLTGNENKVAIVFVGRLDCGVSCDGGSDLIYIYSAKRGKPQLLWHLETGSRAYGCSVKSFNVQNKKLTLEVFGQCAAKNHLLETTENGRVESKFVIRDTTRFVFGFDGQRFVRESDEIIPVPARSVMNYVSETTINE